MEADLSKDSEDRIYYARRAMQERQRAETSADQAVRCVHVALAEEYEQRAAGHLPAAGGSGDFQSWRTVHGAMAGA